VRRVLSALLLAALALPAEGQTPGPLGTISGTVSGLAQVGDTVQLCFSMRALDTTVMKAIASGSSGQCARLVVRGCGVAHLFVRSFRANLTDTMTVVNIQLAGMDTTQATGACAPAAPPGACETVLAADSTAGHPLSINGGLQVDATQLPSECNLTRNRFLGGPKLQAAIDSFVARTYPAPPSSASSPPSRR